MRALVTGGAGFIGSNLVDALLARGAGVAVLDDLSTGRRSNLAAACERGAVLYEADVRDARAVEAIVAERRPDVIFHLAAQIDVRRSVEDPAFDAEVNVLGTVNVLRAAHANRVGRVVHSSTGGALYGEADVLPTPEDAEIRPLAPYGQSKHAAEGYARLYAELFGQSVICLRYANVYGPRQDPLGEAGVIAIFCALAHRGGRATVFGDGEQTRDYVHVDDIVAANLAAAASNAGGCLNIGRGVETSVLELLEAIGDITGRVLEAEHAAERAGEVRRSCLDARAAASVLGWEPAIDLREGLARTLEDASRAEDAKAASGAEPPT